MSRIAGVVDNLVSALPISDGKVVVGITLPWGVRLGLAILIAVLLGIFLALLRLISGGSLLFLSPGIIFLIALIVGIVLYFVMGRA